MCLCCAVKFDIISWKYIGIDLHGRHPQVATRRNCSFWHPCAGFIFQPWKLPLVFNKRLLHVPGYHYYSLSLHWFYAFTNTTPWGHHHTAAALTAFNNWPLLSGFWWYYAHSYWLRVQHVSIHVHSDYHCLLMCKQIHWKRGSCVLPHGHLTCV